MPGKNTRLAGPQARRSGFHDSSAHRSLPAGPQARRSGFHDLFAIAAGRATGSPQRFSRFFRHRCRPGHRLAAAVFTIISPSLPAGPQARRSGFHDYFASLPAGPQARRSGFHDSFAIAAGRATGSPQQSTAMGLWLDIVALPVGRQALRNASVRTGNWDPSRYPCMISQLARPLARRPPSLPALPQAGPPGVIIRAGSARPPSSGRAAGSPQQSRSAQEN